MIWALLLLFAACEIATILMMKAAADLAAQRAYDDGVHDANDAITRKLRALATEPERTSAAARWMPDPMDGGSYVPTNFQPMGRE